MFRQKEAGEDGGGGFEKSLSLNTEAKVNLFQEELVENQKKYLIYILKSNMFIQVYYSRPWHDRPLNLHLITYTEYSKISHFNYCQDTIKTIRS